MRQTSKILSMLLAAAMLLPSQALAAEPNLQRMPQHRRAAILR